MYQNFRVFLMFPNYQPYQKYRLFPNYQQYQKCPSYHEYQRYQSCLCFHLFPVFRYFHLSLMYLNCPLFPTYPNYPLLPEDQGDPSHHHDLNYLTCLNYR